MGTKTRSSSEMKSLLNDVFNSSEFHSLFSKFIMENIGQLIKTEVSQKLENASEEIVNLKNEIRILKKEIMELKSKSGLTTTLEEQ